MRQFLRFVAVVITIAVIVGVAYFLIKSNKEYIANHPELSGEKVVSQKVEEKTNISDITLETKENIEKYAKEEKASLISSIKTTINMNIIANVRKSVKSNISKKLYNKIDFNVIASGESGESNNSGEIDMVPDTIPCTIQIAGSMLYIVPQIDGLDAFEYHYRGDNKLIAYVREFAGTNIKATYYFENGELLDTNVNSFDAKYNTLEDANGILQRANELYNNYFAE